MLVEDEYTEIQWLYGVDKAEWGCMIYIEALEYKTHLSRKLIEHLYVEDFSDRDFRRIGDIISSINFNEKMIGEEK